MHRKNIWVQKFPAKHISKKKKKKKKKGGALVTETKLKNMCISFQRQKNFF